MYRIHHFCHHKESSHMKLHLKVHTFSMQKTKNENTNRSLIAPFLTNFIEKQKLMAPDEVSCSSQKLMPFNKNLYGKSAKKFQTAKSDCFWYFCHHTLTWLSSCNHLYVWDFCRDGRMQDADTAGCQFAPMVLHLNHLPALRIFAIGHGARILKCTLKRRISFLCWFQILCTYFLLRLLFQ